MYKIPSAFSDFIAADCDRASFIISYLKKAGLETSKLQLEGKTHLLINFPKNQYNPAFRIKTLIAHYDRIGIGANDNSAAVFCMMEWAVSLCRMYSQSGAGGLFHNIRIIFTDGEELGAEGGVHEQGAFPLAQLFLKMGIKNDDIFVFDCMGRGDVPILAQTSVPPKVSTRFLKAFSELEERAKILLQTASGGHWFCLPCNYSDNASFLANGIPALAITLLPSAEVSQVLSGGQAKTWQLFHTEGDNLESLDPASFELFQNILNLLARMKTVNQ